MDEQLFPASYTDVSAPDAPRPRRRALWVVGGLLLAVMLCSTLSGMIETAGGKAVTLGVFGLLAVVVTMGLVLWDLRVGLVAFLLASALSPRMGTNFRLSDLVVPLIVVLWAGRILCRERVTFRTPLTVPIALVALSMIVSTLWGFGMGTIPDPVYGIFVVVKRLEYFFLFFLALNLIRSRNWARAVLVLFMFGAVIAALVSLGGATMDQDVGAARATGLDEGNYNTFAGYLVIAASLAVAGAIQYRGRWLRLACAAGALLFITGILRSYSREGYFILAMALVALGVIRYRKLLPALAVFVLMAPFVLPQSMIDRAVDAVSKVQNHQTDDEGSNSYTARVKAWEYRWNGWVVKQPVLGNGAGSIAFSVDNEYMLRLVEGGFVGLALFLVLLLACGRYLWDCARRLRGTELEPFAWGLLAAFVALLLQGWVAATWSSIRTMEPFWVLAGLFGGVLLGQDRTAQEPMAERSLRERRYGIA